MATQYIKYAKKCEKKLFFSNYRACGGDITHSWSPSSLDLKKRQGFSKDLKIRS